MSTESTQFIQRIIEEALARSAGSAQNTETVPNEDALARILVERMAGLFESSEESSDEPEPPAPGLDSGLLLHYEALVERNAELARALGACDCWGEDDQCRVCRGEGRPGWCLPDSRLFSRFVRPALRSLRPLATMNTRRMAPAGPRPWP